VELDHDYSEALQDLVARVEQDTVFSTLDVHLQDAIAVPLWWSTRGQRIKPHVGFVIDDIEELPCEVKAFIADRWPVD
jgi:hypothetical protein